MCCKCCNKITSSDEYQSSSMDSCNKVSIGYNNRMTMASSNIICDSILCENKKSLSTSECNNSYQKSKFRRKKRLNALRTSNCQTDESSRLGFEETDSYKGTECYHQTRLSFEENAQTSTSAAQATCIFDCNHELHNSPSSSNNQIHSSGIDSNSTQRVNQLSMDPPPRERPLYHPKSNNYKSNVRHYSTVHPWHRFSFFLILFLILNQFLEFSRVESFGQHGGLTGGGFLMKGGLFAKSDKSKMSVIPQKLIRPKSSSIRNEKPEHRELTSFVGHNQMLADSPYDTENLQEVFRNLE